MESSSSKVEAMMMKPALFRAGIPLAVSLAAFVLARIATRKSPLPRPPEIQVDVQDDVCRDQESFHSLGSESLPRVEDDPASAEEISRARRRIEDMEERKLLVERRFLHYQGLEDQQVLLMELHHKMVLEMNRAEFLERQVSFVEAESLRFHNAAKEHLKLLRLDEFLRSENEKLLRRAKEHSRIVKKQRLQIQRNETEISRNRKEIREKADCIKSMQHEIEELKLIIEQHSYKLRDAEESAASEVQGEKVSIEDYKRVTCELQQLQKHEASQVKELIHLRWSNACLKHELMRRSREEHTTDTGFGGMEELGLDNGLDQRPLEQGDSYSGLATGVHASSRRRKLIAKFKRWVEGSEKTKCIPRNAVSDRAEENHALVPDCICK